MFLKLLAVVVVVAALWYAHSLGMLDGVVTTTQTAWDATTDWLQDMFYPEATVMDAFHSKNQGGSGSAVIFGTEVTGTNSEE